MTSVSQYLNSLPRDKYLHALGSVVLCIVLQLLVEPVYAAALATAAHVAKKAVDYGHGLRDWGDIVGDIVAGAIGAGLALACVLSAGLRHV